MRKVVVLVSMMALLLSCSGDPSGAGTAATIEPAAEVSVACSSFAGQLVTAATFAVACTVDAATADQLDLPIGEGFFAGTARTLCEDDRVLIWNDLGWGYEGQPFTAFHDGGVAGEYVAPQADRDGCAAKP